MGTDSAAVILFAIRSAVKLGLQTRLAYVDSTRRRQLVLPLPGFFVATNEIDAIDFFKHGSGRKFAKGYPRDGQKVEGDRDLKAALEKFDPLLPNPDLNRTLIDYHTKYQSVLQTETTGFEGGELLSSDGVLALLTVQQWRRGYDPSPSTLHRVGGTLVEIAMDYAVTSPELFDANSAKGKALKGFFQGLAEIDFKESEISELPSRLLVAAIETIGENPALVSGDSKARELMKATTAGLSTRVKERLDQINGSSMNAVARRSARLEVQDWGTLVFRTTLATGAQMALENPGRFLGVTDAGNQALVSSLGGTFLDIILDDRAGLKGVLTRTGLETMMKAALKTVGEHPDHLIRTKSQGINVLISGLARDLSRTHNLLSRDILPELVRMTLETTGENIDLYWPDLVNHPERNLLTAAARTTLEILSAPPPARSKWKLEFSSRDLLTVTRSVLDEFRTHPNWLIDATGEVSGALRSVLSATVGVLRRRGNNRLSAPVAIEIIQQVFKAVAQRQEFLDEMPNGKAMVAAAIDTVIGALFKPGIDPKSSWQLLRAEIITGTTQAALEALAKTRLEPSLIGTLKKTLQAEIRRLSQGRLFDLDGFVKSLAAALPPT